MLNVESSACAFEWHFSFEAFWYAKHNNQLSAKHKMFDWEKHRERERAEWKCVRVVRWKAFYFRLNDLQNVSLCWWKRRPRAKLLCKPKYFNEKLSSFYIITGSLSVRRKVYALLLNQHCRHFRDLFTTVAKRIIIKNMQRLFMLKISLRLKTFARLRE